MKHVSNAVKSFVLSCPLLLLAVIAMFISSCQKESLQSISQTQDLSITQKQDQKNECVPFKGEFTLAHTATGVLLTGEGSHIGRFTLVSLNGENTSAITAANGDQIFATYTVAALDDSGYPIVQVSLDHTITGGTGRFAGATGSFVIDALINETLGKGTGTFTGTKCY